MIRFSNENQNSAGNYNSVEINWVRFFFSYETCVAVLTREGIGWKFKFATVNYRWPTTWKHLNWFGVDKEDRLDSVEFEKIVKLAQKQVGKI